MEILQNIFQAEIIQRLGWTLVHFVWQATAVAMVLAIVLKLLQKSAANVRYIIACMALVLIVLMPIVTIRMIDVSAGTIEPVKQAAVDLTKAGDDAQAVIEMPLIELPSAQAAVTPRVPLKDRFIETVEPVLPYVVVGWLVGVFGLSLWHLGGWRQLQRLRRQMVNQAAPALKAKLKQLSNLLGIQKAIEIMESALVQVPTVVGHLKPVILLPVSALTGLSPEQIEAILAHELAHIKRHDYLVNMLQIVVEILGFYHAGVWWVSHKIRVERENCCDDIAVSLCSDRVCYAMALTTMEEIRGGEPTLAVAASGGNLFDRIRRLLGKDSANEGKPSWLPSVIAILLVAALLIPTALALSSNKAEGLEDITTQRLQRLVEDFFKHNYRDITTRKTIKWDEPTVDANGNMSIRYKYEATIWGKDKIIENKVWTFDKQGNFISVRKVGAEDIYSLAGAQALVEDFFANNYQDITKRKTIEWGQSFKHENGDVSIRYVYEATIWGKDKIVSDELFTFDKDGKFVSVRKLSQNKVEGKAEVSKSTLQTEVGKGFGSVIENVLPSTEGRSEKLLDVDTGRWEAKANFGDNDRETHKWIRDNGLDLLGFNTVGEQGLLSFDMAVLPVKSADWERLTAEDVVANWLLDQMEANKITPMTPMEAPDRPATYLFRTRENGIGILQITGFPDNPKGVKIRYKIAKGTGSENPTGQIEGFKRRLEEPVTVHIDKSPDGDRLTVQYAVMAVCKAAGVPYNWDKSAELADPQRRHYIDPVNIEEKIASQAIADMVGPVGLVYGVDANGVYLYKPEKAGESQSNFKVLDVEFEPIHQGKNVVWITVENKSDKSEFFGVNVYSRSVDYGPHGIGWGTSLYEKFNAGQTKKLRYVYKIQGPVTENTYMRLSFYNAKSLKHSENKDLKSFAVRVYKSSDLPKLEIKTVTRQRTSEEISKEIFKTFKNIQTLIKKKDHEKAWGFFTEDYQKSEYQRRGLEAFKLHMEPEHPLHAAFHWDKRTFVMLKRKRLEASTDNLNDRGAKVIAEYRNEKWNIYFVYDSKNNKWKIDDIVGYHPVVLDM